MTLAGGAIALAPIYRSRLMGQPLGQYFCLNPLIDSNPDAVFIMLTNVDNKLNATAIKEAGLAFGRSVFTTTDDALTGMPMDYSYAIKPNLTSRGKWMQGYTVEGTMGVITDANFVEGVIESMKEVGISADNIFIREVNGVENLDEGGYTEMGYNTGADVQVISDPIGSISPGQVTWKDAPQGVFFKKIPYLWPVNSPNSWLLNISKFKAHSMGLTLCAKNLQGSIVANYQQHCSSYKSNMSIASENIQPNVWTTIKTNYDRHVAAGIPRWTTAGWDFNGGLGMETWASRCLDNNSINPAGLHVIEGIYGRDGNFVVGPHDGFAQDFMTNVIIFGKNAFHVDIIGHWLGGHEPGNLGLFHLALERGLSSHLNPMNIPVYEWQSNGSATLKTLTDFDRTPLLTRYMKQASEDEYHMLDQPYEYPTSLPNGDPVTAPNRIALHQNYPNPFNPQTTIPFDVHTSGPIRLDVFDLRGKLVDVLADGNYQQGSYRIVWNRRNLPSGTYFYRLRTDSNTLTKSMVLLK